MTAAIAQQQEAALRPLKAKALVGYALGDFGCNLAFTLGSTFLLYYYTDVAGLSAAAVGTMFFVVRLWDAFADLIAGRAVDRTMTRWGKFRPFILFFAVPLLVMSFLTFHVPSGLGDAATLLYVYLTYAVARPAVLAGQHPLRLARLGDDAVRPPARQAHRGPHPRRRRGQRAHQLHHRPADLGAAGAEEHPAPGRLPRPGPADLHQHHPAVRAARLDRLRPDVPVVPRDRRARPGPRHHQGDVRDAAPTARSPFSAAPASSTWWASTRSPEPRSTTRPTFSATRHSRSRWRSSPPASRSSSRRSSRSWSAGSARRPCSSTPASSPSSAVSASSSPRTASSGSPCLPRHQGRRVQLINTLMFALEADTVEYGEWKTGTRSEGATYAIFSFTRKITQSIGGAARRSPSPSAATSTTAAVADPVQPEAAITAIKASSAWCPRPPRSWP